MKHKAEQLMAIISGSWGPHPIRPINDAVGCFNGALMQSTKAGPARQALGQLFLEGLKGAGYGTESYIALKDVILILQIIIDKDVNLYEIKSYWSHHAPPEFCGGSEDDYCEHEHTKQLAMFDKWGDATDLAFQLTSYLVQSTPNHVTNVRVEVRMHDGDDEYQLGEWTWDKNSARHFWCQTSGGDA